MAQQKNRLLSISADFLWNKFEIIDCGFLLCKLKHSLRIHAVPLYESAHGENVSAASSKYVPKQCAEYEMSIRVEFN